MAQKVMEKFDELGDIDQKIILQISVNKLMSNVEHH